jgi:hypothetical protein
MIDIVNRLRFDATRCEAAFSKGVAGNITEAIAEIERLRAALRLIAWDVEGKEPDLGECMAIAANVLKH